MTQGITQNPGFWDYLLTKRPPPHINWGAQMDAARNTQGPPVPFALQLQNQLNSNPGQMTDLLPTLQNGIKLDLPSAPVPSHQIPTGTNINTPPRWEAPNVDLQPTLRGLESVGNRVASDASGAWNAFDNWARTSPIAQDYQNTIGAGFNAAGRGVGNAWDALRSYLGFGGGGTNGVPAGPEGAAPVVGPTVSAIPPTIDTVPMGGTAPQTAPQSPWERLLAGSGGGVGTNRPGPLSLPEAPRATRPDMQYPTTPVPQQAQPSAYDRTKVDEAMNAAKPPEYKADMKEAILAGLLSSLGGLADTSGSMGQIFGRMLASGAPGFVNARQQEKQLERESGREGRAYQAARANTEMGLENNRLAREDRGREIDYNNAQAIRQDLKDQNTFKLEMAKLDNMIAQGNYQLATDRLMKIREAGVQDAQLDIMEKRLQVAIMTPMLRAQGQGNVGGLNSKGSEVLLQSAMAPYMDGAWAQLRANKDFKIIEQTKPEEARARAEGIAMAQALQNMQPQQRAMFLQFFRAAPRGYSQSPVDDF